MIKSNISLTISDGKSVLKNCLAAIFLFGKYLLCKVYDHIDLGGDNIIQGFFFKEV